MWNGFKRYRNRFWSYRYHIMYLYYAGNINGLIGLDVLLELGVSIDLKNLKLKL